MKRTQSDVKVEDNLKMLKGSMVGSNEESKFTMFHL
jgi:hypothetical protein